MENELAGEYSRPMAMERLRQYKKNHPDDDRGLDVMTTFEQEEVIEAELEAGMA